jgi:hypothetical protein
MLHKKVQKGGSQVSLCQLDETKLVLLIWDSHFAVYNVNGD